MVQTLPFMHQTDASEATAEPTDPECVWPPENTVWYSFTPAHDGWLLGETRGSTGTSEDTTLSVYTGTSGNLTRIACNDDVDPHNDFSSRVNFRVTAGETYRFMIASYPTPPADDLGRLFFHLATSGPLCWNRPPSIVGTPGDDLIVGTPGDDVIVGLGGRDRIIGKAGRDVICGNKGKDAISGSKGPDLLVGGSGSDQLAGNENLDTLSGGAGDDDIHGGGLQDWIFAGPGRDRLAGDGGNDFLYGENGNDYLDGGVWRDRLHGGRGGDSCVNGERILRCEK